MSTTADKKPKYCYTCGKRVQRKFYILYYHEDGKPEYGETRYCANAPWLWSRERHPVTSGDAYVYYM